MSSALNIIFNYGLFNDLTKKEPSLQLQGIKNVKKQAV